jgi:hypothetical protein
LFVSWEKFSYLNTVGKESSRGGLFYFISNFYKFLVIIWLLLDVKLIGYYPFGAPEWFTIVDVKEIF